MGVSSRRRNDAFNTGSTSGRGTPVDPTRVPGAPAVPLITPHFEEAQAQVNTESSNESGIPQSTTEGNGTPVTAAPAAAPIKDPNHGFYKENGDFETDPMKIAAAFTMQGANTRSTGQPFDARFPFYKHPTSGVSIENISKLDESKAKPTLMPAIKVVYKGKDANRFGLENQKPGAKWNNQHGGYEKQGEIRPSGINWTGEEKNRAKHEASYFENLVLPAANKIAEIHQKLNSEKNGGTSSIAAVTDKNNNSELQCSFCGTTADRDTSKPETDNDFITDHAILKNGWCRAAMLAHNTMHPIKGNLEEI